MPAQDQRLYPLKFQPVFKNYLWGGTRLRDQLGKNTGPGICAESWEIVDHRDFQSIVVNGPLTGQTLHQILNSFESNLIGSSGWNQVNSPDLPQQLRGRFPLLIKLLDAEKDLSVQVHPNDLQAARLDPPDLGKTEAWYVVDATDSAMIYAGLKKGITSNQFAEAIDSGLTDECLNKFHPQAGDCIFVPAGTQHAIGAGLLVLEVQEASDTTFRVFDWNRVDANGRPRELHIQSALEVTDFSRGPISPQPRTKIRNGGDQLISCPYFEIRERMADEISVLGNADGFEIIVVLNGILTVEGVEATTGQTLFLPPAAPNYEFEFKEGLLLQILIPKNAV